MPRMRRGRSFQMGSRSTGRFHTRRYLRDRERSWEIAGGHGRSLVVM